MALRSTIDLESPDFTEETDDVTRTPRGTFLDGTSWTPWGDPVKDVAGTNYCHVYVTHTKGKIIAFSAIDNLVKGASGQAVQNMNIIFGLDETLGLE